MKIFNISLIIFFSLIFFGCSIDENKEEKKYTSTNYNQKECIQKNYKLMIIDDNKSIENNNDNDKNIFQKLIHLILTN